MSTMYVNQISLVRFQLISRSFCSKVQPDIDLFNLYRLLFRKSIAHTLTFSSRFDRRLRRRKIQPSLTVHPQ